MSFPSAPPRIEDFRGGAKWIFKGGKQKVVVKSSKTHNSGHMEGWVYPRSAYVCYEYAS